MSENHISSISDHEVISTPVSNNGNHHHDRQEEKKAIPDTPTLPLSEAELLIQYIEQDSRCKSILKLTQKGETLPSLDSESLNWKSVISILMASPQDYHGTAYVTDSLKKEAGFTANINSAANWVDFFSNYPFYFFSFQFLGNIPGFFLGGLLNAGILGVSNLTAGITANRHKKSKSWSNVGIQGMILLSLLKSLVSGVGVELLNNPTGIKQQTANYLIEQQIQQIEELKNFDSPQYQNAKNDCEEGEKEFAKMNKNNPNRDALYIKLYGSWAERQKNWLNSPMEQIPTCIRSTVLEKKNYQAYENAKDKLSQQLTRRLEIGNDVLFLKQEMSGLYQANFTPEGEISSPVLQVQMATLSFFGKLVRGEWANVGFALFFFSLSMITSAIAVMITIKYAQREDVQKSRDEDFAKKHNAELEKLWRDLVILHNQQLSEIKNHNTRSYYLMNDNIPY